MDTDLTSSSGSADGACVLRAHFFGSAELSWLFGVLRPARHSMWSENRGAFEKVLVKSQKIFVCNKHIWYLSEKFNELRASLCAHFCRVPG